MRKILDAFPFVLLLALLPFFFYKEPNLAQSIMIVAITGFCGYQAYLIEKRSPDYEKKFEDALVYLEKKIIAVEKKTVEIRSEVTKSNAEKLGNINNVKKFQF